MSFLPTALLLVQQNEQQQYGISALCVGWLAYGKFFFRLVFCAGFLFSCLLFSCGRFTDIAVDRRDTAQLLYTWYIYILRLYISYELSRCARDKRTDLSVARVTLCSTCVLGVTLPLH